MIRRVVIGASPGTDVMDHIWEYELDMGDEYSDALDQFRHSGFRILLDVETSDGTVTLIGVQNIKLRQEDCETIIFERPLQL